MPVIQFESADDPRVSDFTRLTDTALRRRVDTERGLYLAESQFVFERALAAGHAPRAVLAEQHALPEVEFQLTAAGFGDARRQQLGLPPVPVYTADARVIESLTGFAMHRGVIGSMERPEPLEPAAVIAGARRIVVIEGVDDPGNVGLIFRSAAGLGADGVLLAPRTADPLYRRAVRTSMGTVLQLPWAYAPGWRALAPMLHDAGVEIAALALSDRAVALDEFAHHTPPRLALVLGNEGYGVSDACLRAADAVVQIPMAAGVDSLNVAASAAVALWALHPNTERR